MKENDFGVQYILSEMKKFDKLIVYGAGLVTHVFIEYLTFFESDISIYCVAVSEKKNNPQHILGIPVYEISDLVKYTEDSLIIIATLENRHAGIEQKLKIMAFKNIIRLNNQQYAYIRKKNSGFSAETLTEMRNIWNTQNRVNQILLQRLNNISQDILEVKKKRNGNSIVNSINNNEGPDVSVIIPFYNAENFLEKCLKSVLDQKQIKVEIICIDDGSTDQSVQIVNMYMETYSNIKVIHKENGGLSSARNAGIDNACGRYIYFLDSDDTIREDALSEMYYLAFKDNLDVLYIDGQVIFEDQEMEKKFSYYRQIYSRKKSYDTIVKGVELLCDMVEDKAYKVQASLQMIRRDFLEDNRLRFCEGILYEDNLFNLECITKAERVKHINKQYFIRLVRKGSIITSEVSFKNVYGYFITYVKMTAYIDLYKNDNRASNVLAQIMDSVYHDMIEIYRGLSREQQQNSKDLTPAESVVFQKLISYIN